LLIKRGALPLAIAIHYLGGTFCIGMFSLFLMRNGPGGMLAVTAVISLVGTFFLHFGIGHRLERLAAEE